MSHLNKLRWRQKGAFVKARYDAIYRDIRDSIEGGTYPYQSFLPSEAELTAAFQCSHNTLRRALALLREQGYVQPVHGKGVRVVWREPERTTFTVGGIESFREAGERTHLHAQTEVVTLEQISANERIAFNTGFEEGAELTLIERVRRIDGEALILDRNLFRTASVPGITEEIARTSIYDYAEGELGVSIALSKRAITVERATERDRELLDLGDIDYLAVITSQTFDAQGILIECTSSRHRPDHFCFRDTAVRHHV